MTKKEQQENFMEWVTFIEDRVNEWKNKQSPDLSNSLDYSVKSLNIIESFIIANYNKESVKDSVKKESIDAIISYYGETIRLNLPNSKWFIELEDESSIDFNIPTIKPPIGTLINPYSLFKRILNKKSGVFLSELFNTRLEFIKNPETY